MKETLTEARIMTQAEKSKDLWQRYHDQMRMTAERFVYAAYTRILDMTKEDAEARIAQMTDDEVDGEARKYAKKVDDMEFAEIEFDKDDDEEEENDEED
jgi:hypothetical protein